jgi:hypothetical protein
MSSKTLTEVQGDQAKVRKRAQSATQPTNNIEGHRKRNLANQRNYRNRQKQYVEELEQKLRVFERDGVVATESVQQAARRVQQENAELRRMLESHLGWSSSEIDYRLIQGPYPPPRARAFTHHGTDFHTQPAALSKTHHHEFRDDAASMPWLTAPVPYPQTHSLHANPGLSDRATTTSASSSDQPATPKDTISCEDAAAILADFRSQGDVDLIKGELGCASMPDYRCNISHCDFFAKLADST